MQLTDDGETWRRVVDWSENEKPATPRGDDHHFDPVTARFVRVNLLHHSLNRGVHLVEVRVYPVGD